VLVRILCVGLVHNQCQLHIRQDITLLGWVLTDQPLAPGIVILVTHWLAQCMAILIAGDVLVLIGVCMVLQHHALQTQEMLHAVEFIHKQHASAMQATQEWGAGAPHGRTTLQEPSSNLPPAGQASTAKPVQLENTRQGQVPPYPASASAAFQGHTRPI